MLDALEKNELMITVGENIAEAIAQVDPRYLYHHAKLYIADTNIATVISVNFREADYAVAAPEDISFFVDWFDIYS